MTKRFVDEAERWAVPACFDRHQAGSASAPRQGTMASVTPQFKSNAMKARLALGVVAASTALTIGTAACSGSSPASFLGDVCKSWRGVRSPLATGAQLSSEARDALNTAVNNAEQAGLLDKRYQDISLAMNRIRTAHEHGGQPDHRDLSTVDHSCQSRS